VLVICLFHLGVQASLKYQEAVKDSRAWYVGLARHSVFWVTVGTQSIDAQWDVDILHKMWYMSHVMCWVGCGCFVSLSWMYYLTQLLMWSSFQYDYWERRVVHLFWTGIAVCFSVLFPDVTRCFFRYGTVLLCVCLWWQCPGE
jgi:hypothetical protein